MSPSSRRAATILVGHGAVPADCPRALVEELKRLEGARRGKGSPSARELEADAQLRDWPRTAESDPYWAGLQAVAEALQKALPDRRVLAAYNEFCAPSVEEAVRRAIEEGAERVELVTTMFTRGGVHSEVEIPEIIARLRREHPGVPIRYAWPFPLEDVASFLAAQLRRLEAA